MSPEEQAKAAGTGKKYDAGKPDLQQGVITYFPRALTAVAAVSTFGSVKYSWSAYGEGWMKVPDAINRYGSAKQRHALAEITEGFYDDESNLLHAAHEAWNALARLELLLQQRPLTRLDTPRVVSRSDDLLPAAQRARNGAT